MTAIRTGLLSTTSNQSTTTPICAFEASLPKVTEFLSDEETMPEFYKWTGEFSQLRPLSNVGAKALLAACATKLSFMTDLVDEGKNDEYLRSVEQSGLNALFSVAGYLTQNADDRDPAIYDILDYGTRSKDMTAFLWAEHAGLRTSVHLPRGSKEYQERMNGIEKNAAIVCDDESEQTAHCAAHDELFRLLRMHLVNKTDSSLQALKAGLLILLVHLRDIEENTEYEKSGIETSTHMAAMEFVRFLIGKLTTPATGLVSGEMPSLYYGFLASPDQDSIERNEKAALQKHQTTIQPSVIEKASVEAVQNLKDWNANNASDEADALFKARHSNLERVMIDTPIWADSDATALATYLSFKGKMFDAIEWLDSDEDKDIARRVTDWYAGYHNNSSDHPITKTAKLMAAE